MTPSYPEMPPMADSNTRRPIVPELLEWLDEVQSRFGDVGVWYRGQPAKYDLRPRLFNREPVTENNLVEEFRQRAPAVYNNCPSSNEYANWLTLMQHHNLPTRLLDWTSSPLVAAYNACKPETKQEGDSYIWALAPERLNYQMKLESDRCNTFIKMGEGGHLFSLDHFVVSDRVGNAFSDQEWKDRVPVAVYSPHLNSRMANQHAYFTLHDGKTGLNNRFSATASNPLILDKFHVASEKKEGLRAELDRLGVNASTLYPDLDNLAKYLDKKYSMEQK